MPEPLKLTDDVLEDIFTDLRRPAHESKRVVDAIREVRDASLELWKAAADCDNASRHVDTCAVMIGTRACSCGHDALVAALAVAVAWIWREEGKRS